MIFSLFLFGSALSAATCDKSYDMQMWIDRDEPSSFIPLTKAANKAGYQKRLEGDGVPKACASCYVDYMTCLTTTCDKYCKEDTDNTQCDKCNKDKCAPAFGKCSGLAKSPNGNLAEAQAAAPSGHYHGKKNIMGFNIQVDMETVSAGVVKFDMTGAPGGAIHCAKEAYEVQGDKLVLPNVNTAGDCAHDGFKAADLTWEGATYNAATNTITVKAKYLFITVEVECKNVKSTSLRNGTGPFCPKIPCECPYSCVDDAPSDAPLNRILNSIKEASKN